MIKYLIVEKGSQLLISSLRLSIISKLFSLIYDRNLRKLTASLPSIILISHESSHISFVSFLVFSILLLFIH